jgi:hypothetical protein
VARLRIRIELSRGGLGVPLHKVASVISKSEKFLDLLGEDVHIDRSKGEWLGFDFDRESLNFTAEYVGAVTAQQVQDFNAAFDGTTSLRRDTIAQFASITDAIGEDEIIGFGLYQTDENAEPTEWRCLSRRDALRIAEGIQLLLETDQESHLPAARDPDLGARIFGERREWNLEPAHSPDAVREIEKNLSSRIQRVEQQVEQHSELIQDLRVHSATTETSFRNLLTTVEGFCNQATRRIEMASPMALPAAPTAPRPRRSRRWMAVAASAVGVSALILIAAGWLWPARPAANTKNPAVENKTLTKPEKAVESKAVETKAVESKAVNSKVVAKDQPPVLPTSANPKPRTRIDLDATAPTWVTLVDGAGNKLLAQLLAPGAPRSFELSDATLLTGNAGGLLLSIDGRPTGKLGYAGQVRQIQIKNGKVVTSPQLAPVP